MLRDCAEVARTGGVTESVVNCGGPRDGKLLELALAAGARLVVSGDRRDLLSMSPWRGIEIVATRAFAEEWRGWL